MLRTNASVLCIRALGRGGTALTGQAGVLMIADGLLGQPVEDFILPVTETLDPFLHVSHHLTLDGRLRIVEVGVEAAGFD